MSTAPDRRRFLKNAAAVATSSLLLSQSASADTPSRPRLGVIASAVGKESPDAAIRRVRDLGFSSCQVHVGMSPANIVEPLREAFAKYKVEPTAAMTLGEGKLVWNFYQGPNTIGIVPPSTRAARIDALKRASDLAKKLNIEAVHTHCGFIPENPNEALYHDVVVALRDVAGHCKANGQTFMMETGQETPVTLLRAITDTGLDNVKVNLDVANIILYGKGEPVGALEVIGKYVHGMHAKDGNYPTDPKELGKEVAIGQGTVNFPGVFKKLKDLNFTGPITIEREISGPKQQADILASKKFLQNLIDKTYSG